MTKKNDINEVEIKQGVDFSETTAKESAGSKKKKNEKNNGRDKNRTHDLSHAKGTRYQLRHTPVLLDVLQSSAFLFARKGKGYNNMIHALYTWVHSNINFNYYIVSSFTIHCQIRN